MAANTTSSQASRQRAESLGFLGVVAGVLIAANVAAAFIPMRFDATHNRAYSLSEGSKRVVRELRDTLNVTAYFSTDLPPPFNNTEAQVRGLLAEYQAASGSVRVRFVNPDDDAEREEAQEGGVQAVQHQSFENNAVSVVEGFRGIVFEYHGERRAIPVVQPDARGLEYDITMSIKRLLGTRLPIGVLTGHEGPTLTKGLATFQRMLPTYELREVDAHNEISDDLRALLIIEPQNEVSEDELRRINQFVMNGGSLGVFGGAVNVSLEQGPDISGAPSGSNLNRLLSRWGVSIGENIVADTHCGRVPMRSQFGIPIPVQYPPQIVTSVSEEQGQHPTLFRIPTQPLFFASAIDTTDAFRELDGEVLLRSSPGQESWLLTGNPISLRIRPAQEWLGTMGGETGPFPLAVGLDAQLPSAFTGDEAGGVEAPAESTSDSEGDHVRVLVVGTGSILRDEFLGADERTPESELASSMAFSLNSVDWLAQDSDLIAVRAKSIDEPALDVPATLQSAEDSARASIEARDQAGLDEALERRTAALEVWEARKNRYVWFNTLGVPVAFAALGLAIRQVRKNRRATLKP